MNSDTTLCREFVSQTKQLLSQYPQIGHSWSIDDDKDHCILDIPEQCEGGFPITVEVSSNDIVLAAGGAHTDDTLRGDPADLVSHLVGFIRDLLSPAMRVRERLSGRSPYKWSFEFERNGNWEVMEWFGLCFYNYFGKKTEIVYQNSVIPARANSVEQGNPEYSGSVRDIIETTI